METTNKLGDAVTGQEAISAIPDVWRQLADAVHEWSLDVRHRLRAGAEQSALDDLGKPVGCGPDVRSAVQPTQDFQSDH